MYSISQLIEIARRKYPYSLQRKILGTLTSFHRIQGSKGLWDAVGFLKNVLEENGVGAKIYRVENEEELGLINAPPGWDLKYGEIIVYEDGEKIAQYNTIEHPTLVAAHSPKGSGRSKLVHAEIMKSSQLEGKAVLTKERASMAYIASENKGLELIVWYSPERNPLGVPYTGLFLPKKILDKIGIPVVTLPYKMVSRILSKISMGVEYEIEWNVDTEYSSIGLPVLEACIGDGEYDIIATAHICHPMPGAHDNASGSTALATAIITLNNMLRQISPNTRICFYWIPEHIGTIALFKRRIVKPDKIIGAINYDMVGSIQSITGSTLHIIRSLLYNAGAITPIVNLALNTILRNGRTFHGQPSIGTIRFDEMPYDAGSDHDIFVINGVEAVMVNEWPSKYYHTDLDMPSTLGERELSLVALGLVLSVALASNPRLYKDGLMNYVKNYYGHLTTWYGMEAVSRNKDYGFITSLISRLVSKALQKALDWIEKQVLKEYKASGNAPVYTSSSYISSLKIASELGIDTYKAITKDPKISQIILLMFPALAKGEFEIPTIIDISLAELVLSPNDVKIEYKGLKGYSALRKLVTDIAEWLKSKNALK